MRPDPTVLVTGCSTGIGAATARALAAAGADVVATVRDPAHGLVLEDAGHALPIRTVVTDVRSAEQVDAAVALAVAGQGRLDAVVANAGVEVFGPLEATPDHLAADVFDVNVLGPLRLVRAALPALRAAPDGVIVVVSSILAFAPRAFSGIYGASKAALEALADAVALETEHHGIRVVVVRPGNVGATAMAANSRSVDVDNPGPYDEARQRQGAALAAQRQSLGEAQPADVAAVIRDAVLRGGQGRVPVGRDAHALTAMAVDGPDRYLERWRSVATGAADLEHGGGA